MALILFLQNLFIMCSLLISTSVFGELERLEHTNIKTRSSESLNFLVVGDWGRKGFYNQTLVAHQMGIIGEELDIEFVISTGDNFYDDGLKGVNDLSFVQSFSKIYTSKSLQKPWYNVLGNHDYRGNVKAQLSPILRIIDSRWICKRSFLLNAEIAEFFFFDTTPFVDKYFTTPKDHKYDWRGIRPRKNYMNNLLKDLESALKASNARWKIVVAHHPIRSAGNHGDTVELHTQLLPILQANNIDLYVNGHDHCLEHISTNDSPIQYLTSGGGSKAWKGENNEDYEGLNFYYDGQGFMSVQLTQFDAEVAFYDIFGEVLHKFNIHKQQQQLYSA